MESAGTNLNTYNKFGTNYITKEQLDAADRFYVMETKYLKAIQKAFGNVHTHKIMVLHVRDIYEYGSGELIGVLE